ncbi:MULTISPECIES: L-lactate dehydrogenase [Dictyoglomus]|jgi:L-lactate dehydrogenase|uniref:L-lactate dehydrogenase n=1 Tax=Dictyoglomus turgidum (strain DSM 6724 / Z-1310) TaxID=515635 RepID=B8DZQ2_DICTD|nr:MULTISPECIES: L-lactate dehydrogenase [Dictyoglomus]ACK41985.1 L-lactate dehydrogenase [Dictyoglomus turgidum DSM 6724]HBU31455.1 L-lactate dehydrogenase [Dictyoglomus sp.]
MKKVLIVGAGAVGTSFAYSLIHKGLIEEIVLYDIDEKRAIGEALDLAHGIYFTKPVEIRAGDLKEAKDSDMVVITAGAKQKPGETRLQLLDRNINIYRSLIPEIVQSGFNGIFLIVTNPVDVLTYFTYKFSGFSRNKVIGSGTVLDSSRFAYLLSRHCDVDPRSVNAYVIGEHGDTAVLAWSLTHIGGISLSEFCPVCGKRCFEDNVKEAIIKEVRNSAYKIIEYKGATYYAIGLALVNIVEAIARDENRILPVSIVHPEIFGFKDIPLSLPSIVGRNGVKKVLQVKLSEEEERELYKSAKLIKEVIDSFSSLSLSSL